MIARSGRRVFRTRGLTAGEGFQEQAEYGSLRRRQDPVGQGVGPVSLAQGENEAPGGLEHLPQAGGAGESRRWVSPREPRHFSQRGGQAEALSRIPARAAASLRGVPPRFRAVLAAFRQRT